MKKALLFLLFAGSALAQDCSFSFTFSAAGSLPGATGGGFDNRNRGCVSWSITYTSNGFTTLSLALQSAPDVGGAPGAYVSFAGSVTTGINPNTAITQNTSTFFGYFPWVRVNLSGLTGSGTVTGLVYGWHNPPAVIGGGGSPSNVNLVQVGSTNVVTGGIAGTLAVGGVSDAATAFTTQRPVLIGGVDLLGGAIQAIATDDVGAPRIGSGTGTALADATSNSQRYPRGGLGSANIYFPTFAFKWNGATWDRAPGNTLGTINQGSTATGGNFASSTARPFVIAGQTLTNTLVQPIRVNTVGTIATVAGVGGIGPTDNQAGNAFSTNISGANADIQGPLWVSSSYSYNGTSFSLLRGAYLATFPTSATLTARNAIGELLTEKSSRWFALSNPAAGSQATASIAAEASVRHVADTACFSAASTAAPALTALTVNLRDGATGAGTILATWQIAISAATGQNTQPFCIEGLNLVGTTNTAMTLEWSAALANLIQSVSLTGYNVN